MKYLIVLDTRMIPRGIKWTTFNHSRLVNRTTIGGLAFRFLTFSFRSLSSLCICENLRWRWLWFVSISWRSLSMSLMELIRFISWKKEGKKERKDVNRAFDPHSAPTHSLHSCEFYPLFRTNLLAISSCLLTLHIKSI